MKKHYILTLMACVLCSLSAEAQVQYSTQTTGPENVSDPALVAKQGQQLPQKTAGLLRSAENRLLPDSILDPNDAGGYNKYIYTYTDDGLTASERTILWDYSAQAYTESVVEYDYDAHGYVIRQYNSYGSGAESTTIYQNTYDEQGRLISTYGVKTNSPDNSYVHSHYAYEYDGNDYVYNGCDSTFSADGTVSTISYGKREYYLDEAGYPTKQVQYSFEEVDAEGNPIWYPWYVFEYTYDPSGLQTTNSSINYNVDGERTFESFCETVYSDDTGLNYVSTYSSRYWDYYQNALGEPYLYRIEKKGGNPAIEYSIYSNEDGTWQEPQVRRIFYYPQGSEVANETIGENAGPALKAYATDGSLVMTTNGATHVQVFAVTGACHYNATINGTASIHDLPAGIYIIKAGNEALKISVR